MGIYKIVEPSEKGKTRNVGFYWVREKGHKNWEVMYWGGRSWHFCNDPDFYEADDQFDEVDEKAITR